MDYQTTSTSPVERGERKRAHYQWLPLITMGENEFHQALSISAENGQTK